MENFSKEAIKKVVKKGIKAAFLPVLIIIGIVTIVSVILAASVYFLTIDDGTYKEDDWSSTPYASRQYTTGLKVTTDGRIASRYTIQELWDNMRKNGSRVDLYLNTPKELLQMMYAEMITQLPDLREDTSHIRTLEEWQETFNQLTEEDTEYQTFLGDSSTSSTSNSGDFKKYQLSDAELKGLANVALQEQGSKIGAAAEASLMANRYEEYGSNYGSIVNYVLNSGWWASASTSRYSDSWYASSDVVQAVKAVLVDGNRTLPKYVDEHDFRGDIASATNDGVPIDINDNSAYIQHKTIIKNTMGSTYTFYCFPTEESDPFGYISEQKREQYGDYFYGSTDAAVQDVGYKTSLQGGIIRLTRNLVTGETIVKSGDAELEKLLKDYDTYKDDYDLKKAKQEKDKNNDNEETNEEENIGELLSLEDWMKQKGYTKINEDQWKRSGQKVFMRYVTPEEFNQYINNYKKNPSDKTREEAMKVFTLEKGKGTTSSKKVSSLSNFLFIGDSITVGLSSASLNEENKKALEGVTYKAEVGKAADYWLGQIDSLPSAGDVSGVCVMLGVNNPGNVQSMNNLIDKLVEKYPNVNIYIQKVLPVGTAYTTRNARDFNSTIDSYNMQVQEHCEAYDRVHFIDTSDGYVDNDGFLKADMSAGDGLHIKSDCYDKLVENILEQATTGSTSKNENSSNSSSGSLEMNQEALDSDPDFTNAEAWRESNSPYNTPMLWGQCTWFAWGKFYEIYGFSPGFSGNGNECVDQLVAANPDKFEKSDTPVDGAVFSAVGANHVGIVLRVDGENVTIQDGNYNGVSDPWEVAITDWQTNTYTLSELNSMYGGVVFGNPIGGVASGGSRKSSGQYNIKVATFKEVTTSYSTNDPEDPNGSAFGPETTYEMTTQSINYYDMVKSYTMPFDYLWSLLVITEDRGFVFELLRTIYESDIELTVNDNLNDTTVTTVNNYTVTETAKGDGNVLVEYDQIKENKEFDSSGGAYVAPVTTKGQGTFKGTVNATRKNVTYTTTKVVRTVTNTIEAAITRANIWIVDYTKNYIYKEEGPNSTQTGSSLENQSENRELQQEDINDIIRSAESQAPGSVTSSRLLNTNGERNWSKHDRNQTITTTTHTQGYEEGEKTLREKTAKILIEKKKEDSKQEYVEKEGEVLIEDIGKGEAIESETNSNNTIEKQPEATESEANSNNTIEDQPEEGNLKTQFITTKTFRYKEKNFVTLLSSYQKAKSNTLNVASWLFELLEKNESTVEMLDLTKYLLYKVTDDDRWGVTEFDFSIFDPDNFVSVDGIYGNTIQEKIWFSLRELGYSEIVVAGAMGNIEHESGGFNPSIVESNGEGIGLIQWSFSRKTQILAYAQSKGESFPSEDTQVEFLVTELTGKGKATGYATQRTTGYIGDEGIPSTNKDWENSQTIEDSTLHFMRFFESPASKSSYPQRLEAAKKYYNEFKGKKRPTANGGDMPTYYQTDYNNKLGNVTIAIGGCGPTSMAMVVSALTGNKITPVETCAWCEQNGYYINNAGTSHAYFPAAATHYGIKCDQLGNNISAAQQALKSGKYVICLQGPGIFTTGGHYIVLKSIDSSGNISVRDPYGPNAKDKGYNNRKFTASEISAAAKQYWALYK